MSFAEERQRMVDDQLVARGISDAGVLAAMRVIPRHLFVDTLWQHRAYEDSPLPIDAEQTISQPYMVALMTQLLELNASDRVLEIGTGSGYQAAVLAELAAEAFSIERVESLAQRAQALLERLGYGERVHLRVGDGVSGWPEAAPFNAIVITAAVQQIPRPLVAQLADGGRLVLPLGESELQELARIRKQSEGLQLDYFGACRFVKLIGEYGWEG
jgi:protein-L-isoaspartate(D-aspartate) O-methyltransferase